MDKDLGPPCLQLKTPSTIIISSLKPATACCRPHILHLHGFRLCFRTVNMNDTGRPDGIGMRKCETTKRRTTPHHAPAHTPLYHPSLLAYLGTTITYTP